MTRIPTIPIILTRIIRVSLEIIMRLSKVRVIADRPFEHSLSRSKLPDVHEIDALVVSFES